MIKLLPTLLIGLIQLSVCQAQVYYEGIQPGKAKYKSSKNKDVISNNVIQIELTKKNNVFDQFSIKNNVTGFTIEGNKSNLFQIITVKNDTLNNQDFIIQSSKQNNTKNLLSTTYLLSNKTNLINIELNFSIAENDNFIKQSYKVEDKQKNVQKVITNIVPKNSKTFIAGTVDGSPVVSENLFFAIENPLFKTDSTTHNYYVGITAPQDLLRHQDFTINSVIGTTPQDQLRRGFLYYLEKNRARAYKPFLHYNSWYDLSYNADPLKEKDLLDRVDKWTNELTVKRNIKLDGFLWDSGWDDFDHLWTFNQYLPNGFKEINKAVKKDNIGMGVWLSPWGGYDDAVVARMKGAKQNNPQLELNQNGFTVAQPNYYKYFRNSALNFVKNENVTIFKLDGVGAGLKASGPGKEFIKDIEGFLTIVKDIRTEKPDTYFSLTVGTWPSPFWLMYGDNIWRGGSDMGLSGKGSKRQKWMNYRDLDTYNNIVKRAPLYPLNAVMNHGLTIGTKGLPKSLENDTNSLSEDMWTFFGTGTSLQEMYVNPHLLKNEDWTELTKVISWARAKKDILVDTHWVGGNPEKNEVYGYASWNATGGVLLLRNPSDNENDFTFTLDGLLEIPKSHSGKYTLENVRNTTEKIKSISSNNQTIKLKPFEVKVFNVQVQK